MYKASGVRVNDDTIRLVTNLIGQMVYEEDCRQTDAVFRQYDTGSLQFSGRKKGTLYIEADGAALNTRHKNDEGSTWRENKLGVIFSTDNIHCWRDKEGTQAAPSEIRQSSRFFGRVQASSVCPCRPKRLWTVRKDSDHK
ncbi:MAG: hypothetical protein LUF92_03660 [Clostridiales bacterium]|nr:hypothetical protein [Clostridiales bacterium]